MKDIFAEIVGEAETPLRETRAKLGGAEAPGEAPASG